MFLLILDGIRLVGMLLNPLHSTMFLLIHMVRVHLEKLVILFTFHYVSINTINGVISIYFCIIFTFHYVSINTPSPYPYSGCGCNFTFHYVSINTAQQNQARFTTHVFTFHYVSINTN